LKFIRNTDWNSCSRWRRDWIPRDSCIRTFRRGGRNKYGRRCPSLCRVLWEENKRNISV